MKTKWTAFFVFLGACSPAPVPRGEQSAPAQGAWIQGDEPAKLSMIEAQFRGFDMAMVEVGYRYKELYWAGEDQNWEVAAYQQKKLSKAIRMGLIRRPKRAKSGQPFLDEVMPTVAEAIEAKSGPLFQKSFATMTAQCTVCHAKEGLPTFVVRPPMVRASIIFGP